MMVEHHFVSNIQFQILQIELADQSVMKNSRGTWTKCILSEKWLFSAIFTLK